MGVPPSLSVPERPLWIAAEGLFLAALAIGPWLLGGAPDLARYALCAVLFLATGL
jgi:hypothetical protein